MIENFLAQYPRTTQTVYRQALLEAEGTIGIPLAQFTHDDIVKYQYAIREQAPSTVSRKLATLASFFKYLNITEQRVDNPTRGIRRPKVDPLKSVRWLTDQQADALLSTASDDARSHALVWLALHGLRLSEITKLNVEQYADGFLWNVEGKGNKTRTIPLAEEARFALERYIGGRRNGPLFLSTKGKRISFRTVQEMVYHLSRLSGEKVSVHALRHTYGTRAIRFGVNPITLARLMGHESTQTTNKYVHLDPTDLQKANAQVYPTRKARLALITNRESKPA